ncbi:rho GTPase-activating protein 20-like [Limulus polyphemus]|uniref:Rho GTPase-activating protein 20-like n=1 Tax=Limulus polyphemus TaxID=6850 RepID=A0ABM1TCP2_LIMPO|nr:rho GTPase-activating protein 20-like [Limulus polyphemus]XP_022253649.1 rho GTPase-activating protein 20-like [Limulus polyphemus]
MGLSLTRQPRIERIHFGVPLEQVCKDDIPAPLLVLILKLNKEGPYKKDIFRAPGHHKKVKKLIQFLKHGKLINIDSFSTHTLASVLKKFIRKLPGGIFGPQNENMLFNVIDIENTDEKLNEIHRLIISLPSVAQYLLVLLFGTFHAIAISSPTTQNGMSSEALGVSVAPSFFQSCASDRSVAIIDVPRFKVSYV